MTSPAAWPAAHRFLLLSAGQVLPRALLAPFFVLLMAANGLSFSTIGLILATYSFVTISFQVPTGALADHIGYRKALLIAAVLSAVGYLTMTLAGSAPAFLIAWLFIGAGRSIESGPLEAWYVGSLKEPASELVNRILGRMGLYVSLTYSSAAVLAGLAAGVVYWLGQREWSLRTPAVLSLAAQVLVLGGLLWLLPGRADGLSAANPGGNLRSRLIGATAPLKSVGMWLKLDRSAVGLLLAMATAGIAAPALEVFWQPRFAELLGVGGRTAPVLGLLGALSFLGAAAGSVLGPRLPRILGGEARSAAVMRVIGSVSFLGMGLFNSSILLLVPLWLVGYVVIAAVNPNHNTILHRSVSNEFRATALSASLLAFQGGTVIGLVGLTAVATNVGVGRAWLAAAVLAAMSSLAYWYVAHRTAATPRQIEC